MFNDVVEFGRDAVTGIKGCWSVFRIWLEGTITSTNLDIFNAAIKNGSSIEDAALRTLTGQWAKDNGFDGVNNSSSSMNIAVCTIMSKFYLKKHLSLTLEKAVVLWEYM